MAQWKIGTLAVVMSLFIGMTGGWAGETGKAETIYMDADTATWRSKGRVSFPLVPSLRSKLIAAGFTVVPDAGQPHDLTLKIHYREERGRNAVNALAAMEAQEARTRIEQAAEHDPHQTVRDAAKAALSKLPRS